MNGTRRREQAGPPLYHLGVSDGSPVSTEAVMEEIRGKIRDDLHARLIGHGAVSYTHLTLPTNREV